MALKSHVSDVASELGHRVEEIPALIDDAKKTAGEWSDRARGFVRKNPGTALVGALAVGFLLAKAARYA